MNSSTQARLEDVKAALRSVDAALADGRKSPLWLLKPDMWRMRRQRDLLRSERARLEAERQREKDALKKPSKAAKPAPSSSGVPVAHADAIVTAAEINERHGTGVLLQRLFRENSNTIHVRSMDLYGGETTGALRLRVPAGFSRDLPTLLEGSTVRRILSVPYSGSDVENTLVLKQLTGAPLCVWLMDHNLGGGEHQIPSHLMQELLNQAELRLGISPEFCTLYEGLFGHKVHFAPPVVEASLGQTTALPCISAVEQPGVLLGNVWSQRWLQHLADTVAKAEIPLVAYGHKSPQWVKHDALARHVEMKGFLPEAELVQALRVAPFAIVPTGTLDADDDLPDIARYSLPSRTLYLSAVGNLPILVTGHEDSGVAKFVRRHGLGTVIPYDGLRLSQASQWIREPEQQVRFRHAAAAMAPAFACDDALDWIWRSLELGRPADGRWTEDSLKRIAGCTGT